MKTKHKVLIVDDDVIFHMIAERYIVASGLDMHPETFNDGQDLKHYFEAHYNKDVHYIIFLDINMPIMSGWDYLDWVKSEPFADTISVFIVTSSKNPNDKKKADSYTLIKGFLTKPFNNKYSQLVREILNLE